MRSYSVKDKEGRTVALPGGGALVLRPVTTPSFEAAKAAARKKRSELLADALALAELGLNAEDLANSALQEGLYLGYLIAEVGARHAISWSGVADETGEQEAPCTPDNVRKLLKHPSAATALWTEVVSSLMPDVLLKKDLGTVANGISAAVPNTAPDAKAKAPRAPPASAETAASSAPT